MLVQILTQAVLEERVFNGAGHLCNTDSLAEIADGRRGVASAAQTAEGGHTGIVPAGNAALLDEPSQLALAQNGIVDAEAGKLYLARL